MVSKLEPGNQEDNLRPTAERVSMQNDNCGVKLATCACERRVVLFADRRPFSSVAKTPPQQFGPIAIC